jgi:hypothetical protein
VNAFVTLAIPKRVSRETATRCSRSAQPRLTSKTTWPSRETAAARPTFFCFS